MAYATTLKAASTSLLLLAAKLSKSLPADNFVSGKLYWFLLFMVHLRIRSLSIGDATAPFVLAATPTKSKTLANSPPASHNKRRMASSLTGHRAASCWQRYPSYTPAESRNQGSAEHRQDIPSVRKLFGQAGFSAEVLGREVIFSSLPGIFENIVSQAAVALNPRPVSVSVAMVPSVI